MENRELMHLYPSLGMLAEELNRAQNRFFSSMSHEIRPPINSILGLNELILRQSVPRDARLKKLTLTEKAQGYSDLMRENAMRMNRQLLKGFTAEEEEQLFSFLERLQKNVCSKG